VVGALSTSTPPLFELGSSGSSHSFSTWQPVLDSHVDNVCRWLAWRNKWFFFRIPMVGLRLARWVYELNLRKNLLKLIGSQDNGRPITVLAGLLLRELQSYREEMLKHSTISSRLGGLALWQDLPLFIFFTLKLRKKTHQYS